MDFFPNGTDGECYAFEWNSTVCCRACPAKFVVDEGPGTLIGKIVGVRLTHTTLGIIIFALLYPHAQLLYNRVWLWLETHCCCIKDESLEAEALSGLPSKFLEIDLPPGIFAPASPRRILSSVKKRLSHAHAHAGSTSGGNVKEGLVLRKQVEDSVAEVAAVAKGVVLGVTDVVVEVVDEEEEEEESEDEKSSSESSSADEEKAEEEEEDEDEVVVEIPSTTAAPTDPPSKKARCDCDAKTVLKKVSQAFFHVRIPTNGLVILIGIILGAIIKASHGEEEVDNEMLSFNAEIVLLILFPPLMLSYTLGVPPESLISNLPFILLHAVGGTIIVAFSLALCFYYIVGGYDFLPCLVLGTALSSVDPEAVLDIFRARKLNSRITAHLELETFFKDVVVVVLFSVFSGLGGSPSVESGDALSGSGYGYAEVVLLALSRFAWVFVFSLIAGVLIGAFAAFASKFAHRRVKFLQPAIVLIFGYLAWFVCELCLADGTLGILFAGLVMSRYIRENMGRKELITLQYVLDLALLVFSGLIFIYVGISISSGVEGGVDWGLIICANVAIFVLRFLVIHIVDWPYNLVVGRLLKGKAHLWLPYAEMIARGCSGQRGAITFALAWVIDAHHFPERHFLVTTAVSCIVFTVFVQGTLSSLVLHLLPIEREPISMESMISDWEKILKSLDEITLCVPELPSTEIPPSPATPTTVSEKAVTSTIPKFTVGQRHLRRALAFEINKNLSKLRSRVTDLRTTLLTEVGLKVDHEFVDDDTAIAAELPAMEDADDDLGFSEFGVQSGSPFLSVKSAHDPCRKVDLEQMGIRILTQFAQYLSSCPNSVVVIEHGDLDQKSFDRMILDIRPRLVSFRRLARQYILALLKEHIEHKFWLESKEELTKWDQGGCRSILVILDHLIQRVLSHRLSVREKLFVRAYAEYRRMQSLLVTLADAGESPTFSGTPAENRLKTLSVLRDEIREVEEAASSELEELEEAIGSSSNRARNVAEFVGGVQRQRGLLKKYVVELERFRRKEEIVNVEPQ